LGIRTYLRSSLNGQIEHFGHVDTYFVIYTDLTKMTATIHTYM
jgi:hypothetical protein